MPGAVNTESEFADAEVEEEVFEGGGGDVVEGFVGAEEGEGSGETLAFDVRGDCCGEGGLKGGGGGGGEGF